MNNQIFNLLFVWLAAHFTTANQSPGFNCPNDGLFKDSHNCQKYYECIWIGTPFEKQKHLKCPIDLIYSPRTHRCDPTDVLEKQFESGISTSEDLLEFIRFRNCIDEALTARPHSQAGFARSESFRVNNLARMKENIHTVNKFLSENIATLARARFDFQKSREGNVARKKILKGGRIIKSGLNHTTTTTPVNLNATTVEVVDRKFMKNNTEKSLLEKFLMRSGMKHIGDFHFKTLYELISSPTKINRTTSMNSTNTSSVGLNETAVFVVATSDNQRNASLDNATLPPVLTKGTSFRLRRLLAVEENDEEETTGTQIASGEFDVTDQSYQSRDQAVDKIANQLSSYKKLDQASEDAVSEQSKLIEKQIKEHLLKRNHMRFGNGQAVQSLVNADNNAPGLNAYANQESINERLKNLAEFLRSESQQVVQPRVYYTPEATSVFTTTKTPSLDSHLPNGQPMFTRMATKNSQLQTYIISQTKVPNYLATQRLESGFSTNAPVDEKHNLIDCKDNDFGLECSCSITLSPPRCKKLINAFLSSCRILGCQNNGICLNMTKDFSSKYEIIFKSQIFLSNSLTL